MAVPKRKWSKARTKRARSRFKVAVPVLNECPQCHQLKTSHRVCRNCGYYKGREVVPAAEA